MHLLLVEPEATGHRMVLYVRLIAQEALLRGWKVTLMTTPSARTHAGCEAVLAKLGDLNTVDMPDIVSKRSGGKYQMLMTQRAYHRAFKMGFSASREARTADFVYVPYLNYIDKITGLLGSPFGRTPFGGMILAARFHHRASGINGTIDKLEWINRILFSSMLRTKGLALVTTIDEFLPRFISSAKGVGSPKLRYVPDVSFVEIPGQRSVARRQFKFCDKDFVIALYGSLTPRKGLIPLLKMFSSPDLPEHFRLILAGGQNEEAATLIGEFLKRVGGRVSRVTILNRFCTPAEESLVFAATDAIWLAYERFSGMSGVLIQAAQSGVPVISSSQGLIDHYCRNESLGVPLQELQQDVAQYQQYDWKKMEETLRGMTRSTSLASFGKRHDPDHFGANVMDAILSCIRHN